MRKEDARDVYITSANLGQLKHFICVTGSEADEMLNFALSNWSKFASRVRCLQLTEFTPPFPDIAFTSKHVSVLRDIVFESKDSEKLPGFQAVTMHSLPSKPAQDSDPKATIEQVQATLDFFHQLSMAQKK